MKIIVIGCGKLGSGLAVELARRGHAVTVVDSKAAAFERLGALRRGRLHDHAPAALERFLEQGRQNILERHVLQMVEQDFRHPVSANKM